MTQALVDADIVAYRCAAVHEELELGKLEIDQMMERILREVNADSYRAFLTGDTNFRKEVDPEYKANRKDLVRPALLEPLKEYLVVAWKAEVQDGIEADDALAMNQTDDTVICSIDKDLLQIPGKHYNFVTGIYQEVDKASALATFYRQFLIGDRADNIEGIAGIGKVKAARIITVEMTEMEMFNEVRMYYDDDERLLKNGRLLYLLRHEKDQWNFPIERIPGMADLQ